MARLTSMKNHGIIPAFRQVLFLAGMVDADSETGDHENIPVMAYVMNELTYHLPGSQRQLHQFGRFV